jgi:hypothetical protein
MRPLFAAVTTSIALFMEPSFAWASCAEDLTRIQLALPKAPRDIQSRVGALVTEAERKAKASDAAGCGTATGQALQLLQLPILASLQLSTPTTDPPRPVPPPTGSPPVPTGGVGPTSAQPPSSKAPATAPGEGAVK